MKKKPISPKANPQMWANGEHLERVAAKHGEKAASEEFARLFGPGAQLPPVEKRHVAKANSFRRWNDLPQLSWKQLKSEHAETKPAAGEKHAVEVPAPK